MGDEAVVVEEEQAPAAVQEAVPAAAQEATATATEEAVPAVQETVRAVERAQKCDCAIQLRNVYQASKSTSHPRTMICSLDIFHSELKPE